MKLNRTFHWIVPALLVVALLVVLIQSIIQYTFIKRPTWSHFDRIVDRETCLIQVTVVNPSQFFTLYLDSIRLPEGAVRVQKVVTPSMELRRTENLRIAIPPLRESKISIFVDTEGPQQLMNQVIVKYYYFAPLFSQETTFFNALLDASNVAQDRNLTRHRGDIAARHKRAVFLARSRAPGVRPGLGLHQIVLNGK
ncbi:MAG: hypothetical protein PWQ41_530 [Bacillota bacterium]|jgi:hypothetical protein|nr:hypothetical protein [Bacillota bacterium]MDK2924756.1 hypothetical protein [Bacillota bacterium]